MLLLKESFTSAGPFARAGLLNLGWGLGAVCIPLEQGICSNRVVDLDLGWGLGMVCILSEYGICCIFF